MESIRRGRVLKAAQLTVSATLAPWGAAPRGAAGPARDAEIEVLRVGGSVSLIRLRCGCGQVHEMQLLGEEVALPLEKEIHG